MFRLRPPFAPTYAHYTHRFQTFIEDLRGMMTVSDLATITGLGLDTVKNIVKTKLEKDYGIPALRNSNAFRPTKFIRATARSFSS